MEEIYDVIVIGSGPSGLICGITAVTGIPLNTNANFSCMILEKNGVGEFARYGRLQLTPGWALMGHELVSHLKNESIRLGIKIQENEEVLRINLDKEVKIIETSQQAYSCKKLAICCGFFPYGNMLRHYRFIRPVFTPIDVAAHYIPQNRGYNMIIYGGKAGTLEMAERLKELRPDLNIIAVIDDYEENNLLQEKDALNINVNNGIDIISGIITVQEEKQDCVDVIINFSDSYGKLKKNFELTAQYILINYDSYKKDTRITSFIKDPRIKIRNGYIKVDMDGNTGVSGVVAAGNIVTPVSGVLTALSSGFTSGINIYRQLFEERFHMPPILFTWLPLGDSKGHPLYK